MRYLWILCLLVTPCFAKEIHVKQGWTIVLPNAKMTVDKGSRVEGYNTDGTYEEGTLTKDVELDSNEEVRITVQEPGGSTVTVPEGFCLTPKRGKMLYLEECGGNR